MSNKDGKNQWSEVESNSWIQPKLGSTAERLARTYNVSHNTVFNDAKGSETTDAIGETSLEAKKKILSGEVKIDKKELIALASATKEELADIAAQIENGTFEKKKPVTAEPSEPVTPVGSMITGMQPLDKAIRKVTDTITAGLPEITKKADRAQLQKALRAYINTLEELYSTI